MKEQQGRWSPSFAPRTTAGAARPVTRPAGVRSWSLWSNPPRVLAYVLGVDLLAVALSAALAPLDPVRHTDVVAFALLTLGALVHIEVARHIERLREIHAEDRPYVDLKSMWSFAGLLMLPLSLALALVVVTFAFWWLRVSNRPVPHRWVFSAATVVIASVAAAGVIDALPQAPVHDLGGPVGLLVVSLAALTRWVVNHGLVAGVMTLMSPSVPFLRRLCSPNDTLLGLGALALGAILAVFCANAPWLVPVLLLPLLAMHRGVLLQQLARAANTDTKTGLATAAFWHAGATQALARARRHRHGLGVLMIDLDEFKGVNDRWGHLVGDQVLRAVADVLVAEVREEDLAGRFGGEEFVVLLADVDGAEVARVAERLRARTTEIRVAVDALAGPDEVDGLSISIGTAMYPHHAADLDDLVLAADTALYEAKQTGRNRVCAAPLRG